MARKIQQKGKISGKKTEEIDVGVFRSINIHFPGDMYILAVWTVLSNKAKSTPTSICGTTLHGLAQHFVSLYGTNFVKPISTNALMAIFESHGITGNPVIRFDKNISEERSADTNMMEVLLPPTFESGATST